MMCTHPDCSKMIEVKMVFGGIKKSEEKDEVHPDSVKCDEHENYDEKERVQNDCG